MQVPRCFVVLHLLCFSSCLKAARAHFSYSRKPKRKGFWFQPLLAEFLKIQHGVAQKRKWHHTQETPKDFFTKKEMRMPKEALVWNSRALSLVSPHLTLSPFSIFLSPWPDKKKLKTSSLEDLFHSLFSHLHLASQLFPHTGKLKAGEKNPVFPQRSIALLDMPVPHSTAWKTA